ncbi:DUF551 domain-containing protein [Massilia sp.]|uniref:DUF551 domain-containing protein n=1 Tax=Massilia sp. TaxID=1882437 RepID=UPI00289AB31A|nr:DUF551 domain-containing protein [Massilia sp.]
MKKTGITVEVTQELLNNGFTHAAPVPASTGRANMDIWNAEAKALAGVPPLPPLPLGIGSGEFINVADVKAWGAACFAAGRGAAIRDYVSLQPVAARELDVEADLLKQAREALELMLKQFTKTPSTLADTLARARGHSAIQAIDAAARSAAQGTAPAFQPVGERAACRINGGECNCTIAMQNRCAYGITPEAAPVSTEQAGDAWISVEDRLPEKECLAAYVTQNGKVRLIRAKYARQFQIEASGDDDCGAEYNENDDTFYIEAGWLECIDNWGEYSSCYVVEGTVTHWMPLPAAPSPNSPVGGKD